MNAVRVLFLISTLGGGGAESQLCSFTRALSKTYPDVEFLICALKRGGVFEEKLKSNNVRYTIIGGRSIIKHIISTVRLVKSERVNLIHAHMLYSDIVARFAGKAAKVKVVSTHHGLGKWKKRWLVYIDKLTKSMVDAFIMVSEKSRQIRIQREKYPPEKVHVIYNGIPDGLCADTGRTLDTDGKIKIGTIARFTDNKRLDLLIDAFRILVKDNKNVFLEIIGEGENEEKLKRQVESLNLNDRVKFYGWVNDIKPIISNWSIFALCSKNEDLPMSMLEAMAQGVVAVATSVGGIPEILKGGKLGVLCRDETPEGIAESFGYLLNNPEAYEGMSVGSISRIKDDFLISSAVKKSVELYDKVLKEK